MRSTDRETDFSSQAHCAPSIEFNGSIKTRNRETASALAVFGKEEPREIEVKKQSIFGKEDAAYTYIHEAGYIYEGV
ncbi:hypothetical protein QLX08_005210 [Tetragonisca angustula]|uniref:Uncharacterized protein n=1 Tax=Tetragonisca angustula TaxID=166442 RepID=A0AAW0ZZC1_9HYME